MNTSQCKHYGVSNRGEDFLMLCVRLTLMLKNTIAEVAGCGVSVIDKRTVLGRELTRWRAELVQDLGGPSQLSVQQQAVVDLAVRTKLLLDSVDAWLLAQPSLIDK